MASVNTITATLVIILPLEPREGVWVVAGGIHDN
jgi:hypothetical protein